MTTHFGFRMYNIDLRRGRLQPVVPFEQAGPVDAPHHFRHDLLDLLSDLRGKLLLGQPKVTSPDGQGVGLEEGETPPRSLVGELGFRFVAHRETEGLIVGVVRRGRYGSFDLAMGGSESDEDLPLTGRAPSLFFRYVINLPTAGSVGLLAVEDISTSCPADPMLKWLGNHSHRMATSEPSLGTGTTARPWWRILGQQVTDQANLERLLREGAFGEIKLVKKYVKADRTLSEREYTVTSTPKVSEGRRDDIKQVVTGWRESIGGDKPRITDADGAKQLAAIVSPDLVGISFDDGQIALPGTGGRALKPSKLGTLFTYDQTPPERRTSGVAFYRAIRAEAARLGLVTTPATESGLAWPEEVNLEFPEVQA